MFTIKIARHAGFCFGVRRAFQFATAAVKDGSPSPIHTLGELVHNRSVSDFLRAEGVEIAENFPDFGTVIIRAHGISPAAEATLRANSRLTVIDATCPLVKKNQLLVEKISAEKFVVIAGEPEHAEIRALIARAPRGAIVSSLADAENIAIPLPAALIAQTTFSSALYEKIGDVLQKRFGEKLEIHRTICAATEDRQREISELARTCDAIVIVGSEHSANTARLVDAARDAASNGAIKCRLVESPEQLQRENFANVSVVGVGAGASAPDWQIAKIVERLREFASTRFE